MYVYVYIYIYIYIYVCVYILLSACIRIFVYKLVHGRPPEEQTLSCSVVVGGEYAGVGDGHYRVDWHYYHYCYYYYSCVYIYIYIYTYVYVYIYIYICICICIYVYINREREREREREKDTTHPFRSIIDVVLFAAMGPPGPIIYVMYTINYQIIYYNTCYVLYIYRERERS